MKEMTIGRLGAETETKVETIRFYERIGILPNPPRTESGYRLYGEEHVSRLRFVRRARALGFSLDAVRTLLDLAGQDDQPCEDADRLVAEQLVDVQRRIDDLIRLRDELTLLKNCCDSGGTVSDCRILDALGEAGSRS